MYEVELETPNVRDASLKAGEEEGEESGVLKGVGLCEAPLKGGTIE